MVWTPGDGNKMPVVDVSGTYKSLLSTEKDALANWAAYTALPEWLSLGRKETKIRKLMTHEPIQFGRTSETLDLLEYLKEIPTAKPRKMSVKEFGQLDDVLYSTWFHPRTMALMAPWGDYGAAASVFREARRLTVSYVVDYAYYYANSWGTIQGVMDSLVKKGMEIELLANISFDGGKLKK